MTKMTTVNLTEKLKAFELEMTQRPKLPSTYDRKLNSDLMPGLKIEVYQSRGNAEDVLFSAQSACEILGLSRNWLNTSMKRTTTMAKLETLGFGLEKRLVPVAIDSSPSALTRKCLALDRSDFTALARYAAAIGREEAVIIRNTFMLLGLLSVTGLTGDFSAQFKVAYAQCQREIEAKNAG